MNQQFIRNKSKNNECPTTASIRGELGSLIKGCQTITEIEMIEKIRTRIDGFVDLSYLGTRMKVPP